MFSHFNPEKIDFFTKKCSRLTDAEIKASSCLFSNNYGTYSNAHPNESKRKMQIALNVRYYENLRKRNDAYVAFAMHDSDIIGQAFYVVENTNEGKLTWVIQLVVHKKYRRHGIAKKLLFSIWGFSNDCAWGLATTNPLTIKTLETATMREVNLETMQKNIDKIKRIAQKVSFIKVNDIQIDKEKSVVFSNFYVAHDDIPAFIKKYGNKNWKFGFELKEGYEWLAFTFRSQDIKSISKRDLDKLFEHSEKCLVDAYSRMKMPEQNWTKHTANEIDFIEKYIPSKEAKIIDIGCGIGRHSKELYNRGYKNIKGYDFSERNIHFAKASISNEKDIFFKQDVRFLKGAKADFAICLYDVIGSFPKESENLKIIKSLHKNLTKNGKAVISVMNMELTRNIAKEKNVYDVYENPKRLFKLKASNTMQSTGDIFNPEYFVMDTQTKLVFRKEMFTDDGYLDSEYIIRDKRYTLEEISKKLTKCGFKIVESRFVQAGHWEVPLKNTDLKAKEILLVVQKV